MSSKRNRIARDIEAVFERLHGSAYSKGHFYEDEFFIRSDYALVVLNEDDEILVSFANHTRPSYSALYALLLDNIDDADLFGAITATHLPVRVHDDETPPAIPPVFQDEITRANRDGFRLGHLGPSRRLPGRLSRPGQRLDADRLNDDGSGAG